MFETEVNILINMNYNDIYDGKKWVSGQWLQ